MFPDIVPLSDLDQTRLELGEDYLVSFIKASKGYFETNELVGKFKGLNALFEYQMKAQRTTRNKGESSRRKQAKGEGFFFFERYEDAIDTYLNHPDKIMDFQEAQLAIESTMESGKKVVYDTQGDFLDVGRYLEGEPEAFGSLTNGNPRNKRVSLIVDLAWYWGTPESTINARQVCLVRLVDWLESQNVRTQIIGISSDQVAHLEIVVKQFDEPLVLSDIAVVAHSDFLRRILFRWKEYSPTWKDGYGTATMFTDSFKFTDWEPELNDEYTVFVCGGKIPEDAQGVRNEFELVEKDLRVKLEEEYSETRVLKVLGNQERSGSGGNGGWIIEQMGRWII